jgi:putative tricarboxylic transport membrane protein
MRRYGYPVAAAAIAVILGPGLEGNLRRGLLLTQGSVWSFVTRPYTAVLLAVALGFLIYGTIGTIRLSRMAAATRKQSIAALQACLYRMLSMKRGHIIHDR